MNKDQVKGALKEAAGEAQEHLGRLVGSKRPKAMRVKWKARPRKTTAMPKKRLRMLPMK